MWFLNFILNQKGVPAFQAGTLAELPTAGYIGRIYISTDTFAFYRDNGTTWDLVGGPGSGTITGTGTNGQVAYFTASGIIASTANALFDGTRLTAQELYSNTDAQINGVSFGRGGSGKLFNIAAGAGALGSNTSLVDGYNVAVGFEALGNHPNPQGSIAIGAFAASNGVGFGITIAIGYNALRDTTTGSQNIAIGYEAIYANTTGSNNTAIGHDVMYFHSTGSRNTAVGSGSLRYSGTGNDNVAVGNDAGSDTANGNSNSLPIQCVYIGSESKSVSGTGGQTNEIVIGYDARGNGSNTVTIGNTSILNTYLRGAVNVNKIIAQPLVANDYFITAYQSNSSNDGWHLQADNSGNFNFIKLIAGVIQPISLSLTAGNTITSNAQSWTIGPTIGTGVGDLYLKRTFFTSQIYGTTGSPVYEEVFAYSFNNFAKVSIECSNSFQNNNRTGIRFKIKDAIDANIFPLEFVNGIGNAIFSDSITTGTPTGGTSQPWKFGSYVVAAAVQTGYVEVDINGTLYKLLAST